MTQKDEITRIRGALAGHPLEALTREAEPQREHLDLFSLYAAGICEGCDWSRWSGGGLICTIGKVKAMHDIADGTATVSDCDKYTRYPGAAV